VELDAGPELTTFREEDELVEIARDKKWLWNVVATIAGATKDIQRNVIGERGPGLPR
jgi:hypothetical protein